MQIKIQHLLIRICDRSSFRFIKFALVGLLLGSMSQSICAQEVEQKSESVQQLRSAYDASVDELRTALKELKRTEALYLFSDSEESHEHKDHWDTVAAESETLFEEVRDNAYALFLADEQPDDDLQVVVGNLSAGSMAYGHIEVSHRICQKLVELHPDNEKLAEELIRTEIFNNKFDDAVEFKSKNIAKLADYNNKEQLIFSSIEELKKNFDRELKLREKDKTAELPRVEMKIKGKGSVILELFEDEAPETVANFINLTESGFYDGLIFHDAANSFLVHGGWTSMELMSMNKFKSPGYTIYDECRKPERRHHFRGSISMWTQAKQPNSCSAEFSILRMPGPNFTRYNLTVFGRVIEGMEIIDNIENTRTVSHEDGSEDLIPEAVPDTIESMKVIRKRDHDYQPRKVNPLDTSN